MNSYQDLKVWKKGIEIAKAIYKLTNSLPKDEIFGLTNQIKRCSVSISSNIAEGYGRGTTQDYIRFLRIARGSLYELETQLQLIKELELTREIDLINEIISMLTEESKMLNAMIKSLGK